MWVCSMHQRKYTTFGRQALYNIYNVYVKRDDIEYICSKSTQNTIKSMIEAYYLGTHDG